MAVEITNVLHPNLINTLDHYRQNDSDGFPKYHGCDYRNRNGTRKTIGYERGKQCLMPTDDPY